MAVQSVRQEFNQSADTSRLRSPALWGNCPVAALMQNAADGLWDGDDFAAPGDEDGNDTGGYERYIDTSNTIRTLAADTTALATGSRGGVLRLALDATDNDSPVIQRTSANGAGLYLIGNTAGATWPLWFECRVRKDVITDNGIAFFAGLASVGVCADNGLLEDDTGDIVDSLSAIGFRTLHDNGEELDFAYQDGGQTAPTEVLAAMSDGTWVASTWVKLGFHYNPGSKFGGTNKIGVYVNNKLQSTYVTTANIDATTFPENDAMCVCFGAKNGTAAATNFDIDWWYIAQLYDDNFGAQ